MKITTFLGNCESNFFLMINIFTFQIIRSEFLESHSAQKKSSLTTPDFHPPFHLINNPSHFKKQISKLSFWFGFPIFKIGGKTSTPTYNSTLPTIEHGRVVAQVTNKTCSYPPTGSKFAKLSKGCAQPRPFIWLTHLFWSQKNSQPFSSPYFASWLLCLKLI